MQRNFFFSSSLKTQPKKREFPPFQCYGFFQFFFFSSSFPHFSDDAQLLSECLVYVEICNICIIFNIFHIYYLNSHVCLRDRQPSDIP